MAGRGRPPKDPEKRVRKNASPISGRTIEARVSEQMELPSFDVTVYINGVPETREFVWPERTREWWAMWGESEIARNFTATDWSELLDTAVLHARYWSGDFKVAGELRLRTAKFGATPEDRARLRIEFAPPERPADAGASEADDIMAEYENVVNISGRRSG